MNRIKKEHFQNNLKLFYISAIEKQGAFDYWLDDWLFHLASKTYNISFNTAKRYFFKLVPEDFIKEYEY